jgi:hypothetical protein
MAIKPRGRILPSEMISMLMQTLITLFFRAWKRWKHWQPYYLGGSGYCHFQPHAWSHSQIYSYPHPLTPIQLLKRLLLTVDTEVGKSSLTRRDLTWKTPDLPTSTVNNWSETCHMLSCWLRGDIICFVSIFFFYVFLGDNREPRLASENDLYSYGVLTLFFCFGIYILTNVQETN